jgi:thiol-disulfide isomerase/thioredoxin
MHPLLNKKSGPITRRGFLVAAAAVAGNVGSARADDPLPDAIDVMTRIAPQAPPALTFTDVSGRRLSLADYAGHALVVNLWATWCGPCVEELPTFDAAAPALRRHGVLILPISVDLDGAAAVTPFFAAHHISALPVLLNDNGSDMQALSVAGIPATIVVNRAGEMIARLVGAADWSTPQTVAYLAGLGAKPPQGGFLPV